MNVRPRSALAVVTCLLVVAAAFGLPTNSPSHDEYDARRDDPRVVGIVAQAMQTADFGRRDRAAADLAASIADLRVDYDPFLGTPQYVGSPSQLLTHAIVGRAFDGRQVVADSLAQHSDLFGVPPAELNQSILIRDFQTAHNGVRHLTWQQQIGGIDLFRARLRTSVTATGQIVSVSSTFLSRPAGDFVVPAFELGAPDAVRLAADNVGIEVRHDLTVKQPAQGPAAARVYARTPDFADDVEVAKVYFPLTATQVRPAWTVAVPEIGIGNVYDIIVDAVDGTILHRTNRLHFDSVEPITFRVYVSDSPAPGSPGTDTPNGFQFPFVPRELVTVLPEEIIAYSPNGWINDGENTTVGNNVFAHLDTDADNDQNDEPPPVGNPYRVFDFPLDTSMAPSTYQAAAVTQMFYLSNRFHDRLYALGFDEVAANFQLDNFGLGGAGNDRIRADVQDGSTVNNAVFIGQGSDGSGARVQMYIFTGANPDRDASLDSDVVYHELAHGVSIRLHEGTLASPQGNGMGEGWSDFFGIVLNAEPADDVHAVYCTGGYTTLQFSTIGVNNYYYGIRRLPYSTDLNKNPLTYEDIDPAQFNIPPGVPQSGVGSPNAAEVHNVGEVWCMALMECRANVVDTYGFPGNELILQLVVDGMKLSANSPNFLQARDAILQADIVNNAGANLQSLWLAFAKRGMGYSATSPPSNSVAGIQEAFDTPPPLLTISYPFGRPELSAPTGGTTITVDVTGFFGGVIAPDSAQLHTSTDGAAFVVAPMTEINPSRFSGELPAADCGSRIRWYVTVQEQSSGLFGDPDSAPAQTYEVVVATAVEVAFADDFESDLGWITPAPGDNATSGLWTRVDPNGTAAQPENDFSLDGTQCYVTGQGTPGGSLGENDIDGGTTTLISPTFALDPTLTSQISYGRWYSNSTGAAPNSDTFVISISNNDGASWTVVETVGPNTQNTGGWIEHSFFVNDVIVPTDQMKMRFVASDLGSGSLVEAALDEFRAAVYTCAAVATCSDGQQNGNETGVDCGGSCAACAASGDCDGGGAVDLGDHAALVTCLTGPSGGPIGAACPCVDFDDDDDVDLGDVGEFTNELTGP